MEVCIKIKKTQSHHEYNEQILVFHWANLCSKSYPCLKYLNSSQNGVKMNSRLHAYRAKRAGLKKGVPDINLPVSKRDSSGNITHCGLYIELKRKIIKGEPKPTITKEQDDWIKYLQSQGYDAMVCFGANEAIDAIKKYIGYKEKI